MQKRIILHPDGRVVEESFDTKAIDITLEDYLLKQAKKDMTLLTPSLGATACSSDLRFLASADTSEPPLALLRLPHMNFHTAWTDVDGQLRPTFARPEESSDPVVDPASLPEVAGEEKKMLAIIPSFMELWWCISFDTDYSFNQATLAGILETPPSVLESTPTAAKRRLVVTPTPNTYDDGELCTGELALPREMLQGGKRPSYIEAAGEFLNQWTMSRWNRDLFDSNRQSQFNQLFKWDIDGTPSAATHEEWHSICRVTACERNERAQKFFELRMQELELGR